MDKRKETTNSGQMQRGVILPGFRAMVYDMWANGRKGYYENKGEMKAATVMCRYGYVSEYMEQEHGRKAAIYPDCVDVIFDHDGRLSKGHFTEGIKAI